MFTCASPRRRATVSSPRTSTQYSMPVLPLEGVLSATGNKAKPQTLTRRAPIGERQQHLDTIPEQTLGTTSFSTAIEPNVPKTHIPNLQAPLPVVHASAFGHKRMMSAPSAHMHMAPISTQSGRPAHEITISRLDPGREIERKRCNINSSVSSSRLKRASTISTINSRVHSLLIPSDSRDDSIFVRSVASSGVYQDRDMPCAFPRWGNAPSVSSFIMADGSINETLPYLRHSASRSIGSRNANAGLSSSRSSSTLQTCASTKAQHLLVPVPARPSNGEFIVVQASGQKCEWKPCWDVI